MILVRKEDIGIRIKSPLVLLVTIRGQAPTKKVLGFGCRASVCRGSKKLWGWV